MRDLAPTHVARAVALIESGQTYRAMARALGARGGSSGEAVETLPHLEFPIFCSFYKIVPRILVLFFPFPV
jgi:hypothetical protein